MQLWLSQTCFSSSQLLGAGRGLQTGPIGIGFVEFDGGMREIGSSEGFRRNGAVAGGTTGWKWKRREWESGLYHLTHRVGSGRDWGGFW